MTEQLTGRDLDRAIDEARNPGRTLTPPLGWSSNWVLAGMLLGEMADAGLLPDLSL